MVRTQHVLTWTTLLGIRERKHRAAWPEGEERTASPEGLHPVLEPTWLQALRRPSALQPLPAFPLGGCASSGWRYQVTMPRAAVPGSGRASEGGAGSPAFSPHLQGVL